VGTSYRLAPDYELGDQRGMSGRPGGWLANNGRQEKEQGGFLRRRGGHATDTKRTSQGEKRYLAGPQGGVEVEEEQGMREENYV
jgi:hypothetical protein